LTAPIQSIASNQPQLGTRIALQGTKPDCREQGQSRAGDTGEAGFCEQVKHQVVRVVIKLVATRRKNVPGTFKSMQGKRAPTRSRQWLAEKNRPSGLPQ
jgi:hypothetical protein